jgi:phosphonate dehydrogenase
MSRPRIIIGHRCFDDTIRHLRAFGKVVAPTHGDALPAAQLRRALADADAWMAFMPDSADDRLLARCARLRIIAGALKGCDNFDVAACTRRGVWMSAVPDLLTVPTAELAIGLMIGLGRHLVEGDRWVRSGAFRGWRPHFYGTGLEGARIGLIGMGVIGQAMAGRLKAFNAVLRYCDPRPLRDAIARELGITRVRDRSALLRWSDYLVLAASLTPATTHIIDASALRQMRRGSLLINPSRGSLVDEAAVLAALRDGHLGGYAADVFEMEDWARPERPRTIASALRRHPATLFTPHLGSAVSDVRRAIERRAADNIIDALSGRVPRDTVNSAAREPDRA